MLKRLELVGFKSFADKTQFDFTSGITAIVGPNGSGKSNIVDAVRWVLGEQSAKSLRGGEMADVIFNGSNTRRSLGLAEVTMTFDNSRRVLATDAEEVQITRRVYRDGEGEYLINHQLSRLKDIKDLFLGSGAGADAYCIIEQGRVDVLLQASTKDRRTIFEEAAGISRFKAKKVESLRKLERVDQNLQRLQDIVDEVDKQLRSVKLQASKAQRYQEYSERLKALRVALGLQDYQKLVEQLQTEAAVLRQLQAGLEEQSRHAEACEAQTRILEDGLALLDQRTHEQESLLAGSRQQIAGSEATLGHERSLSADLETDLSQTRQRLGELSSRVALLADAAKQAAADLEVVETQCGEQRTGVSLLESELQESAVRLTELQNQIQQHHTDHLEQMRRAAHLQNDAVSFKAQLDNLVRERERLLHRTEQAVESLATVDLELEELTQADDALQRRLAAARQDLADHRREQERLTTLRDQTAQAVADLKAERSGLASRIAVLEGLERSHEGLGTGVREVLGLLRQANPGPWDCLLGIVADFLDVRREFAPLIDLALGERAQRFLVRESAHLEEALQQHTNAFAGRVSFLPLDAPQELSDVPEPSLHLPDDRGIVARAEELVRCERPELANLPARLLGRTLIVHDIPAARTIARQAPGYRFVTLAGELLEPDGTLTVGAHHAEMGILSRKSELRELRQQVILTDQRLADAGRELSNLREQLTSMERRTGALQEAIDVLAEQGTDLRSRLTQHRQRRQGLHEEVSLGRTEMSGVEQEIANLERGWKEAADQAEAADRQVLLLQSKLDQAERAARECDRDRQERQQRCTEARVVLAQVEERLSALRAKHRQIDADWAQRGHELSQAQERLTSARARLADSLRTMLEASSSLAREFLAKEAAERQLAALTIEREERRQERQRLAERAQAARAQWQAQQEQAHAHELQVHDLTHGRDTLVGRLQEDYQLNLAELHLARNEEAASGKALAEPVDRDRADEEITELRRKLSRLGSVNLDSLQELTELETRAATLKTQQDDLVSAKRSLEEIIGKINQDSRRLFSESFAAIRTHFQELFRKLFGGGMADIVLEDETDILDSGIEIIARPPGKELRSISLMSGGEKTMTAVALLLAIFRSKPSPFCILDEVDAALDEANIGRFTSVLRDFLDRSHFIIITHSKRTMSVADVLYGVTMQESGVSKRVAVRFEDWPEDGRAGAEGELAKRNAS